MADIGEGVSVKQVLALAPHVNLTAVETVEPPAEGAVDTWKSRTVDTAPTSADVDQWIADVASMVDSRLFRRHHVKNEDVATSVLAGANAVVAVGAAATLIGAMFPAKSGVNDESSYSAELWARFYRELEALVESVDQQIADQDKPSMGGTPSNIRGTFREPTITDDLEW